MNIRSILCGALLTCAALPATAAIVTTNFTYHVDFADSSVVPSIGLSTGSLFTGSVQFDDAGVVGNQVTIVPGSGDTFVMNFGSYSFNESSDLAGGPLLTFTTPVAPFSLSAMLFDAILTIGTGPAAGNYLLSFSGDQFQLTPEGNTVDFKMAGTAVVPVPAALPLLAGGLGLIAATMRRRKARVAG